MAHSLGGIIVKDVSLRQRQCWTLDKDGCDAHTALQAIRRSTACRTRSKLIIFLGTPHRGSTYAGWGEIAANLALLALQDTNKKIIRALAVDGEVLDNIHDEFKTIIYKSGIRVHSFQEAQGISGMKGLGSKVRLRVGFASAAADYLCY